MGAQQRTKGIRIEREVVRILKTVFPKAERAWAEQMIASSGNDIKGCGNLVIQVKGGKRPPIMRGFAEALAETEKKGGTPVCVTKLDNQPYMIHMRLDDWLVMLAEGIPGYERQ